MTTDRTAPSGPGPPKLQRGDGRAAWRRLATRLPWLIATAVILGVAVSQVILTLSDWHLSDAGAYWQAALRLRAGEPLYPPLATTELSEIYRYAPWFAWLWVPLTFLPREVVMVAWSAVLLVASALALVPMARQRGWLALVFFGFILFGISGIGNVQPLIVAVLVLGVERRSGPLWIALAASLKVVPVLFALVYVGRGEWRRAIATLGLTAALVAPMLLYDLSHYSTEAGPAALLFRWLPVYVAVVLVGCVATLRLARTRYGWLAASAAVTLASPRFFIYDLSYLLVGAAARHGTTDDQRVRPRRGP